MPRRVTLNSELGVTDRSLRKLLEESESESADKIKRNLVMTFWHFYVLILCRQRLF